MPADALNRLDGPRTGSVTPGDTPSAIRRRYLTDTLGGPGVGFYADARTTRPAFRDEGRRLTTDRDDPHVVRDLVAIAEHRGWSTVAVRGQTPFRREVWIAARVAGLQVQGYRPTERDLQDLERRRARRPRRPEGDRDREPVPARERLAIVETVVRARIDEPSLQEKVIAAAHARLAAWLERGPAPAAPGRERHR